MISIGLLRIVKLPYILQTGGVMNNLPRCGTGSFARPVIENRDLRMQSPDQRLRIGEIPAVMCYQKRSTVPSRLLGQASSSSFFLVRSPRSRKRNWP